MDLAAQMQAAQMEDLLGRILRGKDAEVKAHPCIQANVNFPLRSGPRVRLYVERLTVLEKGTRCRSEHPCPLRAMGTMPSQEVSP
jgi:hypothetical protein